jgi:hypothetical protein
MAGYPMAEPMSSYVLEVTHNTCHPQVHPYAAARLKPNNILQVLLIGSYLAGSMQLLVCTDQ